MNFQLLLYIGIVILYLYLIIIGIELVIVEENIISQNDLIYNYVNWINILYFSVVIYFILKIVELFIEMKFSKNNIDIQEQENNSVIEKKLKYISSPTFFIYMIMSTELIINFIFFMFGKSFIENNKTSFMEIQLFKLYIYPKMIMGCVVSISYSLIIILWILLLLDAFFCNSFFVNNMTKKSNNNSIKKVKKRPRENYLRKRRNRISVGDDL